VTLTTCIQSARNEAIEIRNKTEELEIAKKRKAEERRQQEDQEKVTKRRKALSEKKREEVASDAKATNKGSLGTIGVDQEMTIQSTEYDNSNLSSQEKNDECKPATKDSNEIKIQEEATIQNILSSKDTNGNEDDENTDDQIKRNKNHEENEASNDNCDEALPEIFDGGPDSDDE